MITTEYIFNKIENQIKKYNIADKAAVLIPIVRNHDDQLCLLFEVRSSTLKWQPGDICFPGGKMEVSDHNAINTALRETEEELGIEKDKIKVYGQLPSFLSAIGLKIYPVVGECLSTHFKLNEAEVADTFMVPINWFISNPPLKATMEVAHKPAHDFPFELIPKRSKDWQKRSQHDVYFYHYQHHVIWGLTAQIIQRFLTTIE